jgi:hypothetical protein
LVLPLLLQLFLGVLSPKPFGEETHATLCVYFVAMSLTELGTEGLKRYCGTLRPVFYGKQREEEWVERKVGSDSLSPPFSTITQRDANLTKTSPPARAPAQTTTDSPFHPATPVHPFAS